MFPITDNMFSNQHNSLIGNIFTLILPNIFTKNNKKSINLQKIIKKIKPIL